MVQVEGKLFIKPFRIDVRVASDLRPLPLVSELAASKRQPFVSNRIVADVATIEADGFAIEEVGEGFIRGSRIAERAGSQCHSAKEVFIQLAVYAKANTNACPVAIQAGSAAGVALEETLAAYPNVAIEAEAPEQTFYG